MALNFMPSDAENFAGLNPPLHPVVSEATVEIQQTWRSMIQADQSGDQAEMSKLLIKSVYGQMKHMKAIEAYLVNNDKIINQAESTMLWR